MSSTLSAFDLVLEDWKEWCRAGKVSSFVGKQIFEWIYRKGNLNPSSFSNIPLFIRQLLKNSFDWHLPAIDSHLKSQDGSEKFLLRTDDNFLFEMVLMPYENRTTLCISCQVGCKMGCTFCQTGKMGFKRNLSSGEILAQILLANQVSQKKVTNVVFMGMGEPLDNYEAVLKACKVLIAPDGLSLSKSRVTISTSGLVPEIQKLGKELPVRLAISLHSADEEQRSAMMPINRKYSLQELKTALLEYPLDKHGITFEYVMIDGINDSITHAKKLVKYLHGLKAKVNLIPVNHYPGMPMHASSSENLQNFQAYLSGRSIPAPIRYSCAQDISGGCGQLAAKRENELDLNPIQLRTRRRQEPSSQ